MKIVSKILILASIMLGFGIRTNIVSASELTETLTGYYWDRTSIDGHEWSGSFKYYYLDGMDSYCLDPYTHEGSPMFEADWNATNISNDLKERILLITYYGYNYPNHQTLQYRATTQAMIWETVTGHTVRFFTGRFGVGTELDISNERQEVERLIAKHSLKPSFVDRTYTVQVGEQLILEDTNNVLSNYNPIINNADYEIDGNKLKITVKNNNTLNIFLNQNSPYNTPYKIFVSDVYQHQVVPGTVDPPLANFRIKSYYGKLDITKKDSEIGIHQGSATLSGAKYGVYKKDTDELVTTIITDENGNATTGNILEYGDYYVKETSNSVGYQIDNTKYYFDMKGKEEVHLDVFENVIKGKIKVIKQDSETNSCTALGQATLLGAKYQVLDRNNNVVDTLIIDDNCTSISKDLPYGDYTIKEFESPKGYEIDNNTYKISINNHNQVIEIISKDKVIKNYISILKQYDFVDGTTQFLNAEANIKFEIYNVDGTLYDTIVTDKNGYATIEIPYGLWKFHQVNTNTGFEKIYDFYITVDENSEKEQYYNILNNKLSAYLQVFKVDSETGKTIAISNTAFKILNLDTNQYVSQFVSGKVLDTFYTDENGKMITYLKLESGNYKLIEVSAPTGYLKDTDGINFNIGDDTYYSYTTYGAFITVTYKNTSIKGKIEINKVGEDFVIENGNYTYIDKPLSDVVFKIYADKDILSADNNYLYYSKDELVDTITTDMNGYAISKELPLGKYYFVEVKTQNDYVLDKEQHYFELKQIDDKTPIVYESFSNLNYLKKGTLEFTKTDLVNGEAIPNTAIEIYTDNDELIFSSKTDENGKIVIPNLKVGKYYIIEKESSTGYVITDEIIYFEIKENNEVIKAEMKNKSITGTVEITKQDISTGEVLPNTLIEVFNDNDELIFSGKTDDEGKIIIENLKYGKYYFIEKEAPEGYTINTEKMYFEIRENGEIVKATIEDEKIIFDVPNTSIECNKIIYITQIVLSIIGIGFIVYGNKKEKK